MKKKIVDSILVDDAIKRRNIIIYCVLITIFFISCAYFSFNYLSHNKKSYVRYTENSDIDYKVYLKENNFFKKNYAEKNTQYIASLIDYISANFKYNINIDKSNVDFKYSYRVEADVVVKPRNEDRTLYEINEILLPEIEESSYNSSGITINQNVSIDYNHYNELIKEFIATYKLVDIESTLSIKMYINTIGTCENFLDNQNSESVISLVIPLTTKTMAIDIDNDLVEDTNYVVICEKSTNSYTQLILAIIMALIDIVFIIILIRYIIKTRTAKEIYNKELKKILNNYHSYIQKINDKFNLKGYQVLKVNTFTDMLEIRDTLHQPILMVENEDNSGVYFIIPSSTKLLYIYGLKLSNIKKQIEEKNYK